MDKEPIWKKPEGMTFEGVEELQPGEVGIVAEPPEGWWADGEPDEGWWVAREAREPEARDTDRARLAGEVLGGMVADRGHGGNVTLESVNAVLVSLGRAIGQVVSNLESPADAAVAAVDGLLEGIVTELEPSDRETVLALLKGSEKKRAGRRG